MITTLLTIAAITAPPLELHTHSGTDGRRIRAAITTDYYVVCERSAAIRYYQSELRRHIVQRDTAGENFLIVGRTRTKFPPMALDSQGMVILFVKREVDQFNRDHRSYEKTTADHETAKYVGMLSLGSKGRRRNPLPMPWQRLELTAWNPPRIQE